jgi:S-DNA-T family DNA segregation ATPase FtsK/SpoIIIE
MTDELQNDERAPARNAARASWELFSRGARRHADSARAWVRAEGLEALIKERDARAITAHIEREARARKSKRARTRYTPPPRALAPIEIKARAFGKRAVRSGVALAIPCALIGYPVHALFQGDPGFMLVWPATYAYLVWDGWAHRPEKVDAAEAAPDADEVDGKPSLFAKMRHTSTGLKPTPEESEIIHRIATWDDHAAERKLHEVVPGHPVIDESGLLIPIGFGGQWTPAKLDAQADQVRALLAVPDEVRTQIKPGGTADRALLRVRTRIRALDLAWNPTREGIGLDADTGEVVLVDVTDRILVAGMSGAGKSVALRVLMAAALALPNTALVIIDLKVEGALWSHVARVESEPEGIVQLVQELIDEMREREAIMRAQSLDKWEPTPERPRIVVAVDEGAELLSEVEEAIPGLRSLARRARSAEIVLWWATQKPTVTGPGRGLDSAISAQLTSLIALAVSSPTEARNVLGEDATAKGWHAEDLQKGGWALVRVQGGDRAPDPVRVWFMEKEHVKALPAREAWRRESTTPTAYKTHNTLDVALQLSEGLQGVSTARLAAKLGITADEVHARMRAYGVTPEPNAFAMGNGEKARGYRRSVLEAAKNG